MYLLLPPSETKAVGGDRQPLELSALRFPDLHPVRLQLCEALARVSGDLPRARALLGTTPRLDLEVAANTTLAQAPTLPAIQRYTGVLYDALDVAAMTRTERIRADSRLLVTSALFGIVGATDPIPAYRLSAGSRLPACRTTMAGVWQRPLQPVLSALPGPVIDLRSGAYAAFGAVPDAVTVKVLTEAADGSRTVVSHFNKATKGRAARALAITRAQVNDAGDAAKVLRRAGFRVERSGSALTVLT